jgi:hypothetical protein
MRHSLVTVLVVLTVVLAGCASTTGPGASDGDVTTAADGAADGGTDADGTTGDGGIAGDGTTATVNFYVSDAPIDDFRHLNVTITKIGFQYAGEGDGEGDDGTATAGDEREDGDEGEDTPTPNATTTDSPTPTPTGTTAAPQEAVSEPSAPSYSASEDPDETTETEEPTESEADEEETDEDDGEDPENGDGEGTDEDDGEDADDGDGADAGNPDDGEGDDGERAGWIERDVDNRTVDLTELTGPNATLIDSPALPAGEYSKVFVYVSDVEGVLEDGTEVNVKLPSDRLHLNSPFTAGPNQSVDFVFDISVHKAGKSGKYILKPVASQSGTDQPIEPVGGPPGDAGPPEDPGSSGDADDGGPPEDAGDGGPPSGDDVDENETDPGEGGPPADDAGESDGDGSDDGDEGSPAGLTEPVTVRTAADLTALSPRG